MSTNHMELPGGNRDPSPLEILYPDGLPHWEDDEDEDLNTEQKKNLIHAYRSEVEKSTTPKPVKDFLKSEIERLTEEINLYGGRGAE